MCALKHFVTNMARLHILTLCLAKYLAIVYAIIVLLDNKELNLKSLGLFVDYYQKIINICIKLRHSNRSLS